MRLGQLARKLSLRPAQIVEFLSQHNIQIEDNSNTRIEDHHTELVVNHFAPGTFQQVEVEADEPEEVSTIETEVRVTEGSTPDITVQAEPSETQISETEVIRVQKIELSGLKVLGKIELPEPKKKEPVVEKTEEGTEPSTETSPIAPAPERKRDNRHERNRDKRSPHQKRDRPSEWKNPLELQREREAREAEEKKRKAVEREKEKRKRHYEEKRKTLVQNKQPKPVKGQPVAPTKKIDTRPVPKTWLGKFLRWWTT